MRNQNVVETFTTTSHTIHGASVVRTSVGGYVVILNGTDQYRIYEVVKGRWNVVLTQHLRYGTPDATSMGHVLHTRSTLTEALAALRVSTQPLALV